MYDNTHIDTPNQRQICWNTSSFTGKIEAEARESRLHFRYIYIYSYIWTLVPNDPSQSAKCTRKIYHIIQVYGNIERIFSSILRPANQYNIIIVITKLYYSIFFFCIAFGWTSNIYDRADIFVWPFIFGFGDNCEIRNIYVVLWCRISPFCAVVCSVCARVWPCIM